MQAAVERNTHALEGLLERDAAEFLTERRRAEAEDGQLQTGPAQRACVHLDWGLAREQQQQVTVVEIIGDVPGHEGLVGLEQPEVTRAGPGGQLERDVE